MANFKIFTTIVKEFIRALGKSHTYNIRKNTYLIFGVLWGIPVPVVTIGLGLFYKGLELSIANIMLEIIQDPVHVFFLMHPILFGVVFGAMGTIRDDKEKERLKFENTLIEINNKLKETNKKLKELDELKDNFLSMVSHELLSPLTTIQGYATFLKEEKKGPLSREQKEILGIVEEHVDYLNHLIEELIDISKIETGRFEVNLDCLDIKPIGDRALDSVKYRAEENDIVLKNRLPSRLPYVLADKERIRQVLTNLLSNAIKFTPKKGEVSISAEERNNMVEFSIADTGIGIPEDKIDRIFDKFYQVDSTNKRQYGGCGLGLAIVKSIIERHRGRIWVESKVGIGSRFYFELEKCEEEEKKEDFYATA